MLLCIIVCIVFNIFVLCIFAYNAISFRFCKYFGDTKMKYIFICMDMLCTYKSDSCLKEMIIYIIINVLFTNHFLVKFCIILLDTT